MLRLSVSIRLLNAPLSPHTSSLALCFALHSLTLSELVPEPSAVLTESAKAPNARLRLASVVTEAYELLQPFVAIQV